MERNHLLHIIGESRTAILIYHYKVRDLEKRISELEDILLDLRVQENLARDKLRYLKSCESLSSYMCRAYVALNIQYNELLNKQKLNHPHQIALQHFL